MSADNITMNFKELQELDRVCMKYDPFYLENNPNTVLVAAKMTVLRMTDRIAELDERCAKLEAALRFYADRKNWKPISYKEDTKDVITVSDLCCTSTTEGKNFAIPSGGRTAREALKTNVDERGES